MTGSVVLGVLAGLCLDRLLGTKPWLFVSGSLVGLIVGFTGFVLVVQKMGQP